MKKVMNVYLDEQNGHVDLILVNGQDKIVLACYEDRSLLLKKFELDRVIEEMQGDERKSDEDNNSVPS